MFTPLNISTATATPTAPATPGFVPLSAGISAPNTNPPDPFNSVVNAPAPTSGGLTQTLVGGAATFGKSIAQPFVSLAAKPVQLLAKAIGRPDPYANNALADYSVTAPTIKGTAGDILKAGATVGGVLAAPASIGGAALVGAGIGAAQGAGNALQQNAPLSDTVKQAALGGAVGGVTGGAVAGVGQLLGKIGDWGINSLLKPSKADVADGFSLQTIKDNNLGGTLYQMQDKTQNALNDLSSQLRDKLASTDATINLQDVYNQTAKDIMSGSSKLKSFGANTRIENAIQQLGNEVTAVGDAGSLSIPDAQLVKQAAGQFGSWQYGKVDPDSKASEIVYNTFYNKLKTAIEQNSPDGVKEINQQLSKLIPVSNAIVRRIPVFERQSPLSLTDFIGLTASTFEPHALGLTMLNFLSKNGMVANQLMQHAATAGNVLSPYASFVTSKTAASAYSPTSLPQQQ